MGHFLPPDDVESSLPLYTQLLSSNLPLSSAHNELALEEVLYRRLQRSGRSTEIPKLSALLRRFFSSKYFSNHFNILYVLSSLSTTTEPSTFFSSTSLLPSKPQRKPEDLQLPAPSTSSAKPPSITFPDATVLTAAVHALQGIPTPKIINMTFDDVNNVNILHPSPSLPLNINTALHRPCSVGSLLKRLEQTLALPFHGRVVSSVHSLLRNVVSAHRAEVSELLLKIESLSLVRISIWCTEAEKTLAGAALVGSYILEFSGSRLVSELYKLSLHGDETFSKISRESFKSSLRPLLELIGCWMADGELELISRGEGRQSVFDCELWIRRTNESFRSAFEFWTDGFELENSKIPCFLPGSYANMILLCGKAVSFAREYCFDSEFVINTSSLQSDDVVNDLSEGDYRSFV
ncbi:hypothetical protein GEMRC1_009656 [Eukaryota sp. GEM-RC1]